jgi:DNA-binding beta-propeller fold protein YncE
MKIFLLQLCRSGLLATLVLGAVWEGRPDAPIQRRLFGRPPVIVQSPASRILMEDSAAEFRVETLQSVTPLTFQWYRDGVELRGGSGGGSNRETSVLLAAPPPPPPPPNNGGVDVNGPRLVFHFVKGNDAGSYRVRVVNSSGYVESTFAHLTVVKAYPGLQLAFLGGEAVLEIEFFGNDLYEVAWYLNGGAVPAGAEQVRFEKKDSIGVRLRIPVVGFADAGTYTLHMQGSDEAAGDFSIELVVSEPLVDRVREAVSVSTVAGLSDGFADGLGASARFSEPSGIALDGVGNLFVADKQNRRIRKIGPDGGVTTFSGSGRNGFRDGPGADAEFSDPPRNELGMGLCFGASGALYLADTFNHAIRQIDSEGAVSTLAGRDVRGFQDGLGAQARFDEPVSLALDGEGNLYVTDAGNNAIRKVTPNGEVTTLVSAVAGSGLRRPAGIAIDPEGHLWVVETDGHRVLVFGANGTFLKAVGSGEIGYVDGPGTEARFAYPAGIAISADGLVFVSEPRSHVIRKIAPDGSVRTVAGLTSGGRLDGSGGEALFEAPLGLAARTDGMVMVADSLNHQIRRIDLAQPEVPQLIKMILNRDPFQISVRVEGNSGQQVRIQESSNLIDWTTVQAITLESGGADWVIDVPGIQKFYRAISP